MKFKVGDTVRVIESNYGGLGDAPDKGRTAKIVVVNKESTYDYGVDFGQEFSFTHKLGGKLSKPTGRWYDERNLELVETSKYPNKIVITSDGKETLARLYKGDKVVKTATATCHPDDTYDFEIGAKTAFSRLMGDEPLKIEVGKKYMVKPYDDVKNHKCICKSDWDDFSKHPVKILELTETGSYECKDYNGRNWYIDPEAFASAYIKNEKPKYLNGKFVCVKSDRYYFTVGKVYEFVDGQTKDNDGDARPYDKKITKIDEYNRTLWHFIPYVE